jgi:ABC-type branched-subunit amino acid transport system substrate-binding protein
MHRSRLLTCVLALAVSGTLAGCGSLAKPTGSAALGTATADGGDLAVGSTGTSGEVSPGTSGSGTTTGGAIVPGGTTGTTGTAGSGGSTGSTGGSTTGGATGAAVPGGKPIKVGVTYPDVAALGAVFGVDTSEADPKEWINRIITYINKTGGVSGRQLSPVWYKTDLNEDASNSGQRACTTFTQDNRVDVVVNTAVSGETLPACLGRVGVALINQLGGFSTDTADMNRLRNRFEPNAIRSDRLFGAIMKLSAQAGRLPRGAKLGVIVEDCAWGNRIYQNTLEPLAKQLGVTLVKGTHRCVQNLVADLGPVTNDIQRETLRFATASVTHVMFVSYGEAFVVSRFTNQANDQKYYPKYFISTNAYPFNDTRSNATIKHHDSALPNMTGYGYNALMDVGPLASADTPGQKSAQDRCRTADPKEGIFAKEKGKNEGYWFSLSGIRGYCDAFFVLEAVLETNGVRFPLGDFTRGYQSALDGKLSSTLNSGGFFRVPSDGIDGIGLLRPMAWDGQHKQFVYTGTAVAVP